MLEWRQGKDKSITPLERHPVRYYFREQGDMEKQWCGGYSLFGGEIETLTISIACFTRLELHTNLQLVIERSVVNGGVSEAASEDNQEIFLTLSTVSLQYIGTVGTVPALILPLSDITCSWYNSYGKKPIKSASVRHLQASRQTFLHLYPFDQSFLLLGVRRCKVDIHSSVIAWRTSGQSGFSFVLSLIVSSSFR